MDNKNQQNLSVPEQPINTTAEIPKKKLSNKIIVLVMVAVLVIITGAVVGLRVWKNKNRHILSYAECIEKTKLPCHSYFFGDFGQAWTPSPYRTESECEANSGDRECIIPEGNFKEVRWVPSRDLQLSNNQNQQGQQANNENWKIYVNPDYGFQLKFSDAWKDYNVSMVDRINNSGVDFVFSVPTTAKNYSDTSVPNGYYKAFTIVALDKAAVIPWSDDEPHPKFIGRNEIKNFYVNFPQDIPEDLFGKINPNEVVNTFTILPQSISGWKTYSNKEYGFSFQYPSEWGEVKEESGNRASEGNIRCQYIGGPYGIPDTILASDKVFVFTNKPLGTRANISISVLKFDPNNPVLRYCDAEGTKKNLAEDKQQLDRMTVGENDSWNKKSALINPSGIKMLYWPFYFTSIHTQMNNFYKFYHNNLEFEGNVEFAQLAYTPEANEIEELYKQCQDSKLRYEDCGMIAWIRKGTTSEQVKKVFKDFDKVMLTFKFQ